jgi:hypothetical protein
MEAIQTPDQFGRRRRSCICGLPCCSSSSSRSRAPAPLLLSASGLGRVHRSCSTSRLRCDVTCFHSLVEFVARIQPRTRFGLGACVFIAEIAVACD